MTKKTIILSLGLIVKVDFRKSIAAFQKLADESEVKVKVETLLPKLKPLFDEFNLGKMSVHQFKEEFLKILPIKIKSDSNGLDTFDNAWNAMITVDEESIKLLKAIQMSKGTNTKFYIYSDTNLIHHSFLKYKFDEIGFDYEIGTTYELKMAKDKLFKATVTDCIMNEDASNCVVIFGNHQVIENPFLREDLGQKTKKVQDSIKPSNFRNVVLEGGSLSSKNLESILNSMNSPSVLSSIGSGLSTGAGLLFSPIKFLGKGAYSLAKSCSQCCSNRRKPHRTH